MGSRCRRRQPDLSGTVLTRGFVLTPCLASSLPLSLLPLPTSDLDFPAGRVEEAASTERIPNGNMSLFMRKGTSWHVITFLGNAFQKKLCHSEVMC